MGNLLRNVWEGWRPIDFIKVLSDEICMIMSGRSWMKPFITEQEMIAYIKEHQPYYKKSIPEVNDYFVNLYDLRRK